MLELTDIHTYYGESHVLQGVSLMVREGQLVVLLGRNGVGKTTTVRSVVGFTPPRTGSITISGRQLVGMHAHQIARLGIALVPQGRHIFGSLTVREHLDVFKRGSTSGHWNIDSLVSLFPALGRRMRSKGTDLSGGEQQMLAIARALVTNPKLLLMDEPTEGLSPLLVRQVAEVVKALKGAGGMTILLVEQNLSLALELADHVYIMNKGVIAFNGQPEEVREAKDVQRAYLGLSGATR